MLRLYILALCILIFGRPLFILVICFPPHPPSFPSLPCPKSSAQVDTRTFLDSTFRCVLPMGLMPGTASESGLLHPLIRCTSPMSLMLGSSIRSSSRPSLCRNLLLPQFCWLIRLCKCKLWPVLATSSKDRMETLCLDVPLLDPTGDLSGPRAPGSFLPVKDVWISYYWFLPQTSHITHLNGFNDRGTPAGREPDIDP